MSAQRESVADRLAKIEVHLEYVRTAVNDHLHEHRWFNRLVVGTFFAALGGLAVQLVMLLLK